MRGVYTALITPFLPDGSIDFQGFDRVLEDQRAAGVAGVIPCGTTGETPTLSKSEKMSLIQACLKKFKGTSVKVVAGTGSYSTAETIEFSRWASDQGVDGILVVTPYYNKPSQAGLKAHFGAVADAVRCEVILYNVPGRTGVSLTAPTIAALAEHPRIRTIKEATGNVAFSSEIFNALAQAGRSMDVLSGDDATFLPLLSIGASGVISVASNLFPRAMIAIQDRFEQGDVAEARKLHDRYYPLFRDLFIESNPVPIKRAMAVVGFCGDAVRAPLAPLDASSRAALDNTLARCEIGKGSRL